VVGLIQFVHGSHPANHFTTTAQRFALGMLHSAFFLVARVAQRIVDICATQMRKTKHIKLTPETLVVACGLAGFRSVADLARKIGRHRTTVHLAVRYPERYGPTFRAIESALRSPEEVSNA